MELINTTVLLHDLLKRGFMILCSDLFIRKGHNAYTSYLMFLIEIKTRQETGRLAVRESSVLFAMTIHILCVNYLLQPVLLTCLLKVVPCVIMSV